MFNKWFRPPALDPLSISMTGVKLGDRVLVIGCSDPHLIAELAAKAGLSGRTCAVDESPDVATEAGRVALREGVLVETSSAAPSAQPFDRDSFDLVVLRNVLGAGESPSRAMAAQEAARVLRPGGRAWLIDTLARSGIAGLFGGQTTFCSRRSRRGDGDPEGSGIRGRPHAGRTRRSPLHRSAQEEQLSSGTLNRDSPRGHSRLSVPEVQRAHVRWRPPSIEIVSPVIQPAASDARKKIRSAISVASPGRPSGWVSRERSRNFA